MTLFVRRLVVIWTPAEAVHSILSPTALTTAFTTAFIKEQVPGY